MDPLGATVSVGRGAGKAVRIALILSLALNLLFVGLMLGAALRHAKGMRALQDQTGFGPLAAAMSHGERTALRQRIALSPAARATTRQQSTQDASELVAALTAEPWNQERSALVLDRMSARSKARIDQAGRAFLDVFAAMTPAERADFAGRLLSGAAAGSDKTR